MTDSPNERTGPFSPDALDSADDSHQLVLLEVDRQIFEIGPMTRLAFAEPTTEKAVEAFVAATACAMGAVSSVSWWWYRKYLSEQATCRIEAAQCWSWRFVVAGYTDIPLRPQVSDTFFVADATDAYYLVAQLLGGVARTPESRVPNVTLLGPMSSGARFDGLTGEHVQRVKEPTTCRVVNPDDLGDQGVYVRALEGSPVGQDAVRYCQAMAQHWFGPGYHLNALGMAALLVAFYGYEQTAAHPLAVDLIIGAPQARATDNEVETLLRDASLHKSGLKEVMAYYVSR